MVRITRDLHLFLASRRVHHGAIGVVLAALGALLIAHDIGDRRVWLRDFLQERLP